MRILRILIIGLLAGAGTAVTGTATAQEIPCDVTCTGVDEPTSDSCRWYWSYDCQVCADFSRKPTRFGLLYPPQYEGLGVGRYYCGGQYAYQTTWRWYGCGSCPVV